MYDPLIVDAFLKITSALPLTKISNVYCYLTLG